MTMTPSRLTVSAASRLERLVERAMSFAVEEYDDDRAVGRLAWLAQGDHAALDQACDVCLSYLEVDLAVRGRAIGLLARVRYGDLPRSPACPPQTPAPPASEPGAPKG
jgi:hypothetical protein